MLTRSTVSIARELDEQERGAEAGVVGIRGTGWFLSPRLIVTAAHVAEAMHLSLRDWKDVDLQDANRGTAMAVRIQRVAGSHAEKIALLELKEAFSGALVLQSRMDTLVAEESVASLAYPGGRLRFAAGRFVKYGDEAAFTGTALLEMHDGNDRLVLDHGASGAPVLDCDGRAVAVVSTIITQTINVLSRVVRVSTAWQTPNIVAIPIQALKDFVRSD